jgi:Chaperone of endosialidase
MNPMNTTTGTLNLQKLVSRRLTAVLLLVTLSCFVILLPRKALAVTPAPDGDYGNGNTAEGANALFNLSGGQNNTAIGAVALFHNDTGHDNTAVGSGTLVDNISGYYNSALGFQSLFSNTVGQSNTAIGANALFKNTTGSSNTATGYGALLYNTTGDSNTATGLNALFHNDTGKENTATGFTALIGNTTGFSNTANGVQALYSNTTGNDNTATGENALVNNTIGVQNTADGLQALQNNTKGNNNVGLGVNAGANLTTGSNNIDIGANVLGNAGEANTIRIGKQGTQKSTFIAGIFGTPISGSTVVVNSNGKLGVATSSARFKDDVKPMDKASEAILALKPVSFRYKEEIDPEGTPQFGLIAEEVEKINPQLVGRDESGRISTVRYEAVNAMLLNEFLKEHRKVSQQNVIITEMRSAIAKLEATNEQQEKQIAVLTAGLQKVSDRPQLNHPAPRLANHQ